MTPKVYSYIRFSTPEQEKGDSLRRQIEAAEKYAQEHGLELDTTLKLQDLGFSAYKGEHRTKGALGQFLQLVEEGRIKPGSTLLVESLDRLSREQVLDAQTQFLNIINAGIKVVTLSDGMQYARESINQNFGQLIMSIVFMSRGYEESEIKSKRLKAAWDNKRNEARDGKRKLTGRCPAWLKLNRDKKSFSKIEPACRAIEQIFRMKLNGKGTASIARELNQQTSSWKPGPNGWRKSYIDKILSNPAVIGEFQPHRYAKTENGEPRRREHVGDPISDYYPQIIPKDQFYRVQEKLRRNQYKGGRIEKATNLFTHLIKCGYCGQSMALVDKGKPPKGGKYLVCDRARRGVGCDRYAIRYDEFERLILEYCKGLDAQDLLPGRDERESELSKLNDQLDSLRGKLRDIDIKVANLLENAAKTSDDRVRELLDNKIPPLLDEKATIESQVTEIEAKISKRLTIQESTSEQIKNIQELLDLLDQLEGKELVNLRLKIRARLKSLITRINIYPVGLKRAIFGTIVDDEEREPALRKKIQRKLVRGDYDDPQAKTFFLNFRTGSYRQLTPGLEGVVEAEFDHETGRLYQVHMGDRGELLLDVSKPGEEEELIERSKKIAQRVAKRLQAKRKGA